MTTGETAFLLYSCIAFLGFAVLLWHTERTWQK